MLTDRFEYFLLGTWNTTALSQVGREFTTTLDTGFTIYKVPEKPVTRMSRHGNEMGPLELLFTISESANSDYKIKSSSISPDLRDAVVTSLVIMHNSVKESTLRIGRSTGRQHYISPRYGMFIS